MYYEVENNGIVEWTVSDDAITKGAESIEFIDVYNINYKKAGLLPGYLEVITSEKSILVPIQKDQKVLGEELVNYIAGYPQTRAVPLFDDEEYFKEESSCVDKDKQFSLLSNSDAQKPGFVALVCELCGGNDMVKQDGFFVCQFCGTKYTLAEARNLLSGNKIQIDRNPEVENLFNRARELYETDQEEKAYRIAEQILLTNSNHKKTRVLMRLIEKEPRNNLIVTVSDKSSIGTSFKIHVGDIKIGVLLQGETESYRVPKGIHEVYVDGYTAFTKTNTVTIDTRDLFACYRITIETTLTKDNLIVEKIN